MAKSYICDHCGKHEAPDPVYDLPPTGWHTIGIRGTYPNKEYCSAACALAALTPTNVIEFPAAEASAAPAGPAADTAAGG